MDQLEHFNATAMFNQVLHEVRFTHEVTDEFLRGWKFIQYPFWSQKTHLFLQILIHLGKRTCMQLLAFYTRKNGTSCICLLTILNMVELSSLNIVVGRLIDACWNRLFMAWWTNRFEQRCWNRHDKSTAMFIHDGTCCQGKKFQSSCNCNWDICI